jgi:hypothetical protein
MAGKAATGAASAAGRWASNDWAARLRAPGPALGAALRAAQGWGWPAALGAALATGGVLASLLVAPAVERTALDVRTQADALRRQAVRQARAAPTPLDDVAAAQVFRAALPAPARRPARIAAMLRAAERQGVVVRSGEFRLQPDAAIGLARYSVTLPVEGRYAAVRAFVAECLQRDPALALDGVRLARDEQAAGGLRADLRFTLYMRADVDVARRGAAP